MVVWKMTINLTKKFLHFTTQSPKEFSGKGTTNTVATIHCDFHGSSETNIADNVFEVLREDVKC